MKSGTQILIVMNVKMKKLRMTVNNAEILFVLNAKSKCSESVLDFLKKHNFQNYTCNTVHY